MTSRAPQRKAPPVGGCEPAREPAPRRSAARRTRVAGQGSRRARRRRRAQRFPRARCWRRQRAAAGARGAARRVEAARVLVDAPGDRRAERQRLRAEAAAARRLQHRQRHARLDRHAQLGEQRRERRGQRPQRGHVDLHRLLQLALLQAAQAAWPRRRPVSAPLRAAGSALARARGRRCSGGLLGRVIRRPAQLPARLQGKAAALQAPPACAAPARTGAQAHSAAFPPCSAGRRYVFSSSYSQTSTVCATHTQSLRCTPAKLCTQVGVAHGLCARAKRCIQQAYVQQGRLMEHAPS